MLLETLLHTLVTDYPVSPPCHFRKMDSKDLMQKVKKIITEFYHKVNKDEMNKIIKFRLSRVPTTVRVRIYVYPKIDRNHRLMKTKFIIRNIQHIQEIEIYLNTLYKFLHPWED